MRLPTHHLHHSRGADRDPLEVPRIVPPWGGLAQFLELLDVEGVPSVGGGDHRRGVGGARFVRHRLVPWLAQELPLWAGTEVRNKTFFVLNYLHTLPMVPYYRTHHRTYVESSTPIFWGGVLSVFL